MSQKGLRFTLDVDGIAQISTAVTGFTLHQHRSVPFRLEVDIASGLPDLTATDFLEKQAVLAVWQADTAQRYVTGIISEVSLGENNHWQTCYHLTIVPPLWRSGLRQNFRIFQQQDIQTISATLLRENGITDWVPVFHAPHPPREFCVQYGETDLAFLTRLWSEEGIAYFDWHSPDGPEQTLVLCDDVLGVPSLGAFPFHPDSSTADTACISQFRYSARIRPSSVITQDYTYKVPRWPGYYGRTGRMLNGQRTQYEIYDYPGRFKHERQGEAFAGYQIEGWRNNAETATCISNSAKICPGKRFTLTDHPSGALNRQWQTVSSRIEGSQPQALHGSQGEGTTLKNHLTVIPTDRTWRAPPQPKPRVDGPQSAIVTGPAGEEIFCDEDGRVRVRFRWDRYNPGNENSSCWIRVSQAWAGTGFGNLAIPRVGQEVIVDFLNGDPDQPIIMGRTYHHENRSPGSLPLTKTQMTIRSKTYKGSGFNELRFDDANGQEQVYLHAQKNMDTEVLNDRSTTVKHDHTESIANNQQITVGVGQTVNVGSKKEGGHDQRITIANDQTVKVKNDRRVTVSHDDSLSVENDRNVTVKGNQQHSTRGNYIREVKGKLSLEVKGDLAQKIDGALGMKVKSGVVLESSEQITLKVGGSYIVIHSGGIDIMGPKINLNGGGSPGVAVGTLPLNMLMDNSEDEEDSGGNNDNGRDDKGSSDGSGNDGGGKEEDNVWRYNVKFQFTDDDELPYANVDYTATLEGGVKIYGETDQDGYTESFIAKNEVNVVIELDIDDF